MPEASGPECFVFWHGNSITEWYRPSYPVDPDTIAEAVTTMAFQGLEA